MPGLVPGIHDWATANAEIVDGRDKPGHDEPSRDYQETEHGGTSR
jgi:hypothetical protein